MLHITEDTPPDMLAGAMDLTVHLPNGRNVKMAVERSTPMMDLLVQITTNNHLQLSNHTLQVLGMAPSVEHSDKVLPFKPNTPIGALDTQHIKVLPKGKTFPAPKHPPPPGHQPFESTFRLKVHLPRNQLYVTRVSRNVYLEDIMKKVCEEKNLDPVKFELKHPGNLDETLDLKLTLSDYQITEIYVVHKGTSNLSQALSSTDIMTLRKEEERKQMHTKTGGGVFNLIFKRNKSSMGSGSISSDTRSISPTHSDDSRSVTPPAIQATPATVAPPKREPPERPKPPQRKRRPAPPPPPGAEKERHEKQDKERLSGENSSSDISKDTIDQSHSETAKKTISENGLTICHSRNSSDSSGYHEASILSDHNASLPRMRPKSAYGTSDVHQLAPGRPKSAFVTTETQHAALAGGSNLNKLASRSTLSLVTGKKKKAPPPPPTFSNSATVAPVSPGSSVVSAASEKLSPLVASQTTPTLEDFYTVLDTNFTSAISNPKPFPRKKIVHSENTNPEPSCSSLDVPKPKPRRERTTSKNSIDSLNDFVEQENEFKKISRSIDDNSINEKIVNEIIKENFGDMINTDNSELVDTNNYIAISSKNESALEIENCEPQEYRSLPPKFLLGVETTNLRLTADLSEKNGEPSLEEMLCSLEVINSFSSEDIPAMNKMSNVTNKHISVSHFQKSIVSNIFSSDEFLKENKPPEIVAVVPKTPKKNHNIDNELEENFPFSNTAQGEFIIHSQNKTPNSLILLEGKSKSKMPKNLSTSSLRSFEFGQSLDNSMKKWSNTEKLHDSSLTYFAVKNDWVTGDATDTESVTSCNTQLDTPNTPPIIDNTILDNYIEEEKHLESTDSGIAQDKQSDTEKSTEDLRFIMHSSSIEEYPIPVVKHVSKTELFTKEDFEQNPGSKEEKLAETNTTCLPELDSNKECLNSIQETNLKSNISTTFIGNTIDAKKDESATKINIESSDKLTEAPEVNKYSEINKIVDDHIPKSEVKEIIQSTPKKEHQIDQNLNKPDQIQNNFELEQTSESTKKANEPPSLTLNVDQKTDLFEIDWQYQLPSPPKAFRDSPSDLSEKFDCDTLTMTEFKDSVVTQPELFEKIQNFEADNTSETETIKSEVTSIASEEILNTLSLEHLEKRKSLVYNRELATSLKAPDNILHQKSIQVEVRKPSRVNNTHTLPNFKITTYDVPKQKIKVFEDDTIRSNVNSVSDLRKSKFAQSMENISNIRPSSILRTNEIEDENKNYSFFRPKSTNFESNNSVHRSESFFTDRTSMKPVSRSQSHLTLNRFKDTKTLDGSGLQSLGVMRLIQNRLSTPTSSLENLSQINRTQGPSNLNSTLHENPENGFYSQIEDAEGEICTNATEGTAFNNEPTDYAKTTEIKQDNPSPEPKIQAEPEKRYYYSGPPTINMATWSERPKVPVHVKEDADYKLGNHDNNVASKLIVKTSNNNVSSNNSVEVRNARNSGESVNVNYDQRVFEKSGNNVVIKIDAINSEISNKNHFIKNFENSRFQAPIGYRKPFQNINKNTVSYTTKQRPHSIAFDSDFDISRVPVVRSVEFKKPFKDIHTSVTHINQKNDNEPHNIYNNNIMIESKYSSTEHLNKNDKINFESNVLRVNSFKTLDQAPPVVRGFKNPSNPSSRLSWNPTTLHLTSKIDPHNTTNQQVHLKPKKIEPHYITNQEVPFSQSNLRRTDSNRLLRSDPPENINTPKFFKQENSPFNSLPSYNKEINERINKRNVPQNYTPPPPPPEMPSVVTLRKVPPKKLQSPSSPADPRNMLLESIRSFGGKKGLKKVRS